jgi:hypothetical protein
MDHIKIAPLKHSKNRKISFNAKKKPRLLKLCFKMNRVGQTSHKVVDFIDPKSQLLKQNFLICKQKGLYALRTYFLPMP